MTTTAIPCGFWPILLGHDVLNALEDRIHRRIAMGTGFPFGVDLGMAAARATGRRACQRSRVECTIGGRMRQTRCKGTALAKSVAVVGGKQVVILRSRVCKGQS